VQSAVKREIDTHDFFLVDECGLARHIRATIEHDPGIVVEIDIDRFIDEEGVCRSFVGQLVPGSNSIDYVNR